MNWRMVAVTSIALLPLLVDLVACSPPRGGNPSSGPSSLEVVEALTLIADARQGFENEILSESPLAGEMDAAFLARLSDEDAQAIALYYTEAAGADERGEPFRVPAEFEALLDRWQDFPYFATAYGAWKGGAGRGALQQGLSTTETRAQPLTGDFNKQCSDVEACCKANCANYAMAQFGIDLLVAGVSGRIDPGAVSGVNGCADQIRALRQCLPTGCDTSQVFAFAATCTGAAGSMAVQAAKVGGKAISPGLALIASVVFDSLTLLVMGDGTDANFDDCEAWKGQFCCVGTVRCGWECCGRAQMCRDSHCYEAVTDVQPCEAPRETCNGVCCPASEHCVDNACRRPMLCEDPSRSCGQTCCADTEYCVAGGVCRSCDEQLCGAACCGREHFCNAVSQCINLPPGGCGVSCGASCCAPGEVCGPMGCEGEAFRCGDTRCVGETPLTCPADCGAPCGNGPCEAWERAATCPADCAPEVPDVEPGCTPVSVDCASACSIAMNQFETECDAHGGVVVSADLAACVQDCECIVSECPEVWVCQANPACAICDETSGTCEAAVGSCSVSQFICELPGE